MTDSNPEFLPFDHPEVQDWLWESTKIAFTSGLLAKMNEEKINKIALREKPPLLHHRPPGDERVVASMQMSTGAELPVVAYRKIAEYESMEENQYLVKVDSQGRILGGSLTNVVIYDQRTRAVLRLEDEFTRDDLPIMQALLDRQDALPWQPVFDETVYRSTS